MSSSIRQVCSKCGRSKVLDDFFAYKSGEKDDICKACLLEHVDNGDPDTFLWILERYDIPYVERIWVSLSNRIYADNPGHFNQSSVIGKYMRNMKMTQYRRFGFNDSASEELVGKMPKESPEDVEAALKAKLESGEINQSQYDTLSLSVPSKNADGEPKEFMAKAEMERSIKESLTNDDRLYLMTKWGTSYTADEWVRMEDMYRRYCAEYDMSVDREETLKKLCKTSIKMDAALDSDDTLGYKSLSQVFDSLRKTGRFTEQQNKEDRTDVVDSVGQLVLLCEREGGIIDQFPDPEDYPQDKIDLTINDFKQYSVNLLRNEPNVAGLIETYIAKLEKADEKTRSFMSSMGDGKSGPIVDPDAGKDRELTPDELEEFKALFGEG